MKRFITFVLSSCIYVVYIIQWQSCLAKYKLLREYIYSLWMCRILKAEHCHFTFPAGSIIGAEYIRMGEETRIGRYAIIACHSRFQNKAYNPEITIGCNCQLGDYINITSISSVNIGNNVLTGRWVTITDNAHGLITREAMQTPPFKRPLHTKGNVIIGDNVWIGDKVTILPGVSIGKGSIIAANSVVSHDVPPFSVVAGIPAKIIKSL